MSRHFVAIALNLWGDREVGWVDGRRLSEKALGRELRVQLTPTLLVLDERGAVALRLNGYLPPHRFDAALDYAAGLAGKGMRYDDYMRAAAKDSASPTLHDEAFFALPPVALRVTSEWSPGTPLRVWSPRRLRRWPGYRRFRL